MYRSLPQTSTRLEIGQQTNDVEGCEHIANAKARAYRVPVHRGRASRLGWRMCLRNYTYSHLFNKRGGGFKVAKSLNVEVGINVEGGIFF